MKTVLIVDDEERIRKTFGELFQNEGYRVFVAPGVLEANDIMEVEPINLVILDINMPVFDGRLLHEIRQAFYTKTKIIISSVYPVDEQKQRIPGAEDYYDKSEGLKVLMQKVKEVLKEEKDTLKN